MQFTIATIALFASTVLALPAPAPVQSATIVFDNEQLGFSGTVIVPLNGYKINLYNSLAGTRVGPKIPGSSVGAPQYRVFASAARLGPSPQNAACIISGSSTTTLGELNARKTYTKLNPLVQQGVALVDLNGATIKCTPTGKAKRQDPAAVAYVGPATADDIVPDDVGVTVDASGNTVPVPVPVARPDTTVPDVNNGLLVDASGNYVDGYGNRVDYTPVYAGHACIDDASNSGSECVDLQAE